MLCRMQRRLFLTQSALRRSTAAQRAESLWLLWSSEPVELRRNWITATLTRPDDRALRGLLTARARGTTFGSRMVSGPAGPYGYHLAAAFDSARGPEDG